MQNEIFTSKKYSFIVILLVLIGILILTSVSVYVQPLQGDLTRMGGYAERDFGWNIPRKVLSDEIHLATSYDKYYDIVVLGDSFSKSGLWQSFLTDNTNLSFTTLHWDDTTVEDVINNPIFKTNPPKLFIVEMGTRSFPLRFSSVNETCDLNKISIFNKDGILQSGDSRKTFVEINRDKTNDWAAINLKFALVFIENSALRFIFNNDFSKVKKYSLTRNDLFSNIKSGEILLLRTWFDTKAWSNEEISKATCTALEIQNKVQSNGKTIFIVLPIPDKGTAYEKYIINPEFTSMEYLTQKLIHSNIQTTNLDVLIRQAIDDGQKDVFLPNDTHFGTRGYQLTAKSVADLLDDKHIIGSSRNRQ